MADPLWAYLAIGVMALVTLATRLGGALIMRYVEFSPRLTVFLEAMSASVLAAIVATFLVTNGQREVAAVAAALLVMWFTKSALLAMVGALVVAASWFWFLA